MHRFCITLLPVENMSKCVELTITECIHRFFFKNKSLKKSSYELKTVLF